MSPSNSLRRILLNLRSPSTSKPSKAQAPVT